MIRFENVTFAYEKGKPVLSGVSFAIGEGETVGLIGANGAGKSTVMKLLLGLAGPGAGNKGVSGTAEGKILVDGDEVSPRNLSQIRRKLGFVLQNSDNQLCMPMVEEDMMFAPLNYGMDREEAEKKVDRVLEQLNLTDLKYRHNHRISGGEKRMAAIATLLMMEPEAILMDEPSAALDPCNRRIVIDTIRGMDQTRLITSHDLDMILETCERVILLDKGQIVADGRTEEILKDRELLEAHRMELPFCFAGPRYR